MRKTIIAAAVLAATLLPSGDLPGAGRSLVGRKLPEVRFADTLGHTVSPADYEGSVLVMFAGIPW